MKKLTSLLLLIFIYSTAQAVEFEVTTATEREDGSALALDDIKGHTVYCGRTMGVYPNPEAMFVLGATLPTTVINIPDPAIGIWYCAVTTIITEGYESELSNGRLIIVNDPIYLPKPPTIEPGLKIRFQTLINPEEGSN